MQDNMNILRDAAQLQTQLRLYDGLVETRHTLLKLRPNLRQHWVALAVAYHLSGNLTDARKTLEHYERMLKVSRPILPSRKNQTSAAERARLRRGAVGDADISYPPARGDG